MVPHGAVPDGHLAEQLLHLLEADLVLGREEGGAAGDADVLRDHDGAPGGLVEVRVVADRRLELQQRPDAIVVAALDLDDVGEPEDEALGHGRGRFDVEVGREPHRLPGLVVGDAHPVAGRGAGASAEVFDRDRLRPVVPLAEAGGQPLWGDVRRRSRHVAASSDRRAAHLLPEDVAPDPSELSGELRPVTTHGRK